MECDRRFPNNKETSITPLSHIFTKSTLENWNMTGNSPTTKLLLEPFEHSARDQKLRSKILEPPKNDFFTKKTCHIITNYDSPCIKMGVTILYSITQK